MNKQRLISLLSLVSVLSGNEASAKVIDQLSVEPQPAVAGDNLTLVISGAACNPFYSPAELSHGAVTTFKGDECLAPPLPYTVRLPVGALPEGEYIARAYFLSDSLLAEVEFEVGRRTDAPPGVCLPDHDTLCLRGGRFRVEVSLTDPQWRERGFVPSVRLLSFESGAFYFFFSSNPELFVKVLDGCGLNGHYWLFVSGLTNLGVALRVRDMQTGQERVIENPQGRAFVSVQDTAAFACGS